MKALSLKPYLEQINRICAAQSKKDLMNMVLALATEKQAGSRQSFLNKIAELSTKSPEPVPKVVLQTIIEEIEVLFDEINERVSHIENGEYDLLDDWDVEYDYDEDPNFINEIQLSEIENFFGQADTFFLSGNMADAKKVYEELFERFEPYNSSCYYMEKPEINFREERARYARCLYETSADEKKASAMSPILREGMWYSEKLPHESHPLLQDVIDSRNIDMDGLDAFLPSWRLHLEQGSIENHRTATLLIEVVYLLEGIDGLARTARKWGGRQPLGYLFFIRCLAENEMFAEVIQVSEEAIGLLTPGDIRFKIGELLTCAASKSGNKNMVLNGKRELFHSNPSEQTLLSLLHEAEQQNLKEHELTHVLNYFESQKEEKGEADSLYIQALLIAGEIDETFQIAKAESHIGWSYGSNAGLVFGALAFTLANYSEQAITIKHTLEHYLKGGRWLELETDDLLNECLNGIKTNKVTQDQINSYMTWLSTMAEKRTQHIVSNTHRNAYDRAAMVLCSLAEIYVSNSQPHQAKSLIHHYCRQKFPRHVAFKGEVKACINRSPMLKNLVSL